MDKEYIDMLNNYTGLSSVITEIARKQDEYILGELNNKIKIVMGLDIEPKRLEKWVKQSMFIETFSVEQLRDFATGKMVRNVLNDKDNTILELQDQLALTEKALELACERVKYFEELQDKEMGHFEFFGYDTDYDLQAIIEQYKEQAKEMINE